MVLPGIELSAAQATHLEQLASSKPTIPRLGSCAGRAYHSFVFYDAAGVPVFENDCPAESNGSVSGDRRPDSLSRASAANCAPGTFTHHEPGSNREGWRGRPKRVHERDCRLTSTRVLVDAKLARGTNVALLRLEFGAARRSVR